ncbi:hypothetical protein WNY37_09680 [Henriciella sp. AS95]|uniref:hypothetical protein n=1 Tax=Henriciella sp. AS95 TaxID=3135782 RepID=UPI003182827B
MRRTSFLATAFFMAVSPAVADGEALIGQLGNNSEATGERSSADLSQIGQRTVEAGRLVDQIDASQPLQTDIDESAVGETLPSELAKGECLLTSRQEILVEYLMEEGRVFSDTCEVLNWLDGGDGEDPDERDLFNVIFGPEAQRLKQAELERLEKEQAEFEARARIMDAINYGSSTDG